MNIRIRHLLASFSRSALLYVAVIGLVIGGVPLAFSKTAQAVGCDTQFYSDNDILFYNLCEINTCSTSAGSVVGVISSLRGANNGEKIYNFWLDAGFAKEQSAGITGSMQHEGGFSPFRQEGAKSWPDGGWGIAQFTDGQRTAATAYVKGQIKTVKPDGTEDNSVFDTYYSNTYGGPVTESNGFIPSGVPADINDKFLLSELSYLLDTIKARQVNGGQWDWYVRDWNVQRVEGTTIYDYIKTLTTAGDAAKAWTYLYEIPANIKETSAARAESAENVLALYTGTTGSESCGGGLASGGMTLDQAKAFMDTYKQIDAGDPNGDKQYLVAACHKLTDNCVTFSSYFIKKYTTLKFNGGNGGFVLDNLVAANPDVQTGNEPRPYALFSIHEGRTMCGNIPCGHTGIVLGVDTERNKVVIGEAAYCLSEFTGAHEYDLTEWSNGKHKYAYTESYLKSGSAGGL